MKWHIWYNNKKEFPLTWEEKLLEFDTERDAIFFLKSAIKYDCFEENKYNSAFISKEIVFSESGYKNATNLRMRYDSETHEIYLIEICK